MFRWLRQARRKKILEEPFPEEWKEIIAQDVKASTRLAESDRERLNQMVQVFVAEKHFEGAGGLELDDRIRVVIAAQACLMIVALDHDLYHRVESIVIYPSTVYAEPRRRALEGVGVVEDEGTAILGQAHYRGPVILSWDAVRQGAYNPSDGRNVVFHEFAHKLDMLSGAANGAPPLDSRGERQEWAEAFGEAYEKLKKAHARGRATFLGTYAETNPAEFFAVATERFFEQPKRLRGEHPEVYDAMKDFFQQDPAERLGSVD